MANISLLSRLVSGVQRQVDLSANTLVVSDLQINGINLRSSGSGTAGSTAIGDDNSYSHITPASATVKGALTAIDSALGSITGFANQALSNLSAVAINLSLLPGADNSINLGSTAKSWATGNIHTLIDASSVVSLDAYSRLLKDASGNSAVDYANRNLIDSSAVTQLAWSTTGISILHALAMNSNRITGLADPTSAQDAATKNYADNLAHGLSWKGVVRSATTAALPANTYANGTAGVGATLTGNSNAALAAQDGVTLVLNDRLLVKNEATAANNGIYVVTQVGSGSLPYILTRSTDANTANELTWLTVEIGADASTQAGYIFRESVDITTVGTDAVTFVIISHGLDWTFNNGLATTGNQVNVVPGDSSLSATPGSLVVNLNANAGLTVSSGLKINLAATNPGLSLTSNALDVKYNAAGAIVANAAGITWNPDNSSLEISSNAARIKTTAYDQVTIIGGGASAASVAQAPQVAWTETAGQTFVANTTYAVRYGLTANSETAGRVYAADISTGSFDLFNVIGFIQTGASAVTAGNSVTVINSGSITLASADTVFGGTDPGKPIYLLAGGINASTTAPSSSGQAVAYLGIVKTTTSFRVSIRSPYVF